MPSLKLLEHRLCYSNPPIQQAGPTIEKANEMANDAIANKPDARAVLSIVGLQLKIAEKKVDDNFTQNQLNTLAKEVPVAPVAAPTVPAPAPAPAPAPTVPAPAPAPAPTVPAPAPTAPAPTAPAPAVANNPEEKAETAWNAYFAGNTTSISPQNVKDAKDAFTKCFVAQINVGKNPEEATKEALASADFLAAKDKKGLIDSVYSFLEVPDWGKDLINKGINKLKTIPTATGNMWDSAKNEISKWAFTAIDWVEKNMPPSITDLIGPIIAFSKNYLSSLNSKDNSTNNKHISTNGNDSNDGETGSAEPEDTQDNIPRQNLPPYGPVLPTPVQTSNMPGERKEVQPDSAFENKLSHENGLKKATELGFLTKENEKGDITVDYKNVRERTLLAASNIFYNILGIDNNSQKLTITSCCDGEHLDNSAHYDGRGLDIRSKDTNGKKAWNAVQQKCTTENGWQQREWNGNPLYAKIINGLEYKIILENEGKDQEHIHFAIASVAEQSKKLYERKTRVENAEIASQYLVYKPLRDIIMMGESPIDLYDGYNQGKAGDSVNGTKIKITEMAIDDVIQAQKNYKSKTGTPKLFAVGAYQFAFYKDEYLLEEAKNYLGLSGTEKLTPALQDTIFVEYILKKKRPQIWDYISSNGNEQDALNALANEWACLKTEKGKGVHDGIAGNKATIEYRELQGALRKTKQNLSAPVTLNYNRA